MFRYRQQLRRWAAHVLLLWLFGVGAGFANACLASSQVQLGDFTAGHSLDEGVSNHEPTVPGIGLHDGWSQAQPDEDPQGQPGHAAKSNCVDFCDKASVSIPSLKSAIDDVQGHAPPPLVAVTFLPVPVFLLAQVWVPRRDGVRAPPIPIVFLRLAL